MDRTNNKKGPLAQPAFWFAIAIFVFGMLIPNYYLWSANVPVLENLNRIQGILVHQKVSNRRGWKVGLAHGDDLMSFTCSDRIGLRHTCYADRMKLSDHEDWEGRLATVWWYEQPIYLFTTQRRLVQVDIGDTTFLEAEHLLFNLCAVSLVQESQSGAPSRQFGAPKQLAAMIFTKPVHIVDSSSF